MRKPLSPQLSTDGSFDLELTERVVRQLQSSHLHVYEALTLSALPESLLTGSPDDPHTSIHVPLTMVTDGSRGWLILSTEDEDYDVEVEFTELVDTICPGSAVRREFVLRAAAMFQDDPRITRRTLDLSDPSNVRARVEAVYQASFADASPIDHRPFLAGFEACRFPVKDERAVRRFLLEIPGPADTVWAKSA